MFINNLQTPLYPFTFAVVFGDIVDKAVNLNPGLNARFSKLKAGFTQVHRLTLK